jgi:hypothetical protein
VSHEGDKAFLQNNYSINQIDIHWIEEKLLKVGKEIFKEVSSKVLKRI